MPPPNQSTGGRPADLKTWNMPSNPSWKPGSGGRHHIFLFDGTWNDSTGVNPANFTWDNTRLLWVSNADPTQAFPPIVSNLVKTHLSLGPDGPGQLTHYFRGIGNDDENDSLNSTGEGAFATMEEHIRNSAYCTFLQTYQQGDRVSIFGFSRGAASARLFARDLAANGFVDQVNIGSRYSTSNHGGDIRLDVWDLNLRWSKTLVAGDELPIAFLGVWDTVPTNVAAKAADWEVPATVGRCVHCMAIDETRNLFVPTVLAYPKSRCDDMKEVWFPGAHSDVGGGYYNDALARVALSYMWKNWDSALAAQSLPSLVWRTDLAAQYITTEGLPWLRHQATGLTADLGGVAPRDLTPCTGDRPRVHPSVENFVQHGGLQFCVEGAGFPPAGLISSPVYQPLAYPGADQVELYDS
ncbi:MAG: DUF2235 domain-containing protein, partial [Opitutaceae bacterium]